ncbi:MAG: hypothetical protein H7199_03425 [Burkholderiales bacterium]|nr:hypothetical protein [Flavobacterium sp.]
MKKKFAIVNLVLVIAVLFSMMLQSLHSFEHLAKIYSEKHCHHIHLGNTSEITHQHHSFDHCFVCEFTIAHFTFPTPYCYQFDFAFSAVPYFFTTTKTPDSFSGSCYSLRGPPYFIV